MSKWTDGANKQWQQYTEKLKASLDKDSDPEEVVSDMRMHVEAELDAANMSIVTEDDLLRILKRIGLPENSKEVNPPGACIGENCSNNNSGFNRHEIIAVPTFRPVLITIFGIIFPLGAVTVELLTGMCASLFFDPIPSFLHLLVFLCIPLSNFLCLAAISKKSSNLYGKLGLINGFGLGVSIAYTLLFLPLMPIAPFAILAFGFGLCAFAPLFSMFATMICRRNLKLIGPGALEKAPRLWTGIGLAFLVLALLAIRTTVTEIGIQMAGSDASKTQSRGIGLLRSIGDEDIILDGCYRQVRDFNADIISETLFGKKPSSEKMRAIYYRVYGRPFNTVEPPEMGIGRTAAWVGEFDFDQGEATVGAQLKGLYLSSSRVDGSIDSDAALGYIEWTMEFRNENEFQQREARGQIQLPCGAVVSRLTLWIDGEEREAAFASRSKTRQAYQSVVKRQRDPVLVTTSGPDRILMQCFPVPPRGGEMKVRIGITVPLEMLSADKTLFYLPHFNERNFIVNKGIEHAVWIESKQRLETETGSLEKEKAGNGIYALRGKISNEEFSRCSILSERDPEIVNAWTADPLEGSNRIILGSIKKTTANAPDNVVIVVDSSARMKPFISEIRESISKLPDRINKTLVVADDLAPLAVRGSDEIARKLEKIKAVGGMDNVPALEFAWDEASKNPGSVILWIHSAQPVELKSVNSLQQRWDRRPNGPVLIEIQAVPGLDKVVESLDGLARIKTLARTGDIGKDIERLAGQWDGNIPVYEVEYKSISARENPARFNKQTSSHLARLWAKEKVETLRQSNTAAAVATAASYQLVTPVSGAVVLENAQQYNRAGLSPVDSATVPTIPEPEFWAMLAIVAVILGILLVRRDRMVCVN